MLLPPCRGFISGTLGSF